ncbi:hypothetical protein TGRH88_071180 [Toxoplasma gondii]|uniref:Uncharacterized protein n=1 Tax=Toxoplasma gondii TaxID=5811 RepID=A0A7J6K288_TOXGO|nr:hypothetical protein TGRH88_071180 [Toxoplasma gondii]
MHFFRVCFLLTVSVSGVELPLQSYIERGHSQLHALWNGTLSENGTLAELLASILSPNATGGAEGLNMTNASSGV